MDLVGWGDKPVTGTPFWRVRNSWGTFWGELGAAHQGFLCFIHLIC